jgi:hypothetical protein
LRQGVAQPDDLVPDASSGGEVTLAVPDEHRPVAAATVIQQVPGQVPQVEGEPGHMSVQAEPA